MNKGLIVFMLLSAYITLVIYADEESDKKAGMTGERRDRSDCILEKADHPGCLACCKKFHSFQWKEYTENKYSETQKQNSLCYCKPVPSFGMSKNTLDKMKPKHHEGPRTLFGKMVEDSFSQ